MNRDVFAVATGVLLGMAVNMVLVQLNADLHPMPEGVTWEDGEAVGRWIEGQPWSFFLLPLLAHLGQSYVGATLAGLVCGLQTDPMRPALIVGFLTLAGGLANMLMLPHPPWMLIEIPLYIMVAWLGGWAGRAART